MGSGDKRRPMGECVGYSDADLYEREMWYMWQAEKRRTSELVSRYETYVKCMEDLGKEDEVVHFDAWLNR